MAAEVIIVGDAGPRQALLEGVWRIGYAARMIDPREVNRVARQTPTPRAILLCAADVDAAIVLAGLRRTRAGAAIPVLMVGTLGGDFGTLADVLDLGADHFVDESSLERELGPALLEFAGPVDGARAARRGEEEGREPHTDPPQGRAGWAGATARVEPRSHMQSSAAPPRAARDGGPSVAEGERANRAPREVGGATRDATTHSRVDEPSDPTLGQIHRTLDRLEARLRSREDLRQGGEDDAELGPVGEVTDLGFEPVPPRLSVSTRLIAITDRDLPADLALGDGDPDEGDFEGTSTRMDLPPPRVAREAPPTGREVSDTAIEGTQRLAPDESARLRERGTGPRSLDRDAQDDTPVLPEVRQARTRTIAGDSAPRRRAPEPEEDERGGLGRSRSVWRGPAQVRGASGELSPQTLVDLLLDLERARFSGRVDLSSGPIEKSLWLTDGRPHFVRSNAGGDRFVDGLLARGVLTRPQWETARRLVAKDTRRSGRVLVDAGFLAAPELERQLRRHLEHCIGEVFSWTQGRFRTISGDVVDEPIGLGVDVPELIVRAMLEWLDEDVARKMLGRDLACPRLRARSGARDVGRAAGREALSERFDLDAEARRVLEACDGVTLIDDIVASTGAQPGRAAILMVALRSVGEIELIELHTGPADVTVESERISDRLALARIGDYFELLGISRDATRAEIRRAYGQLATTFNDEAFSSVTLEQRGRDLEELRSALSEAQEVLLDDALRTAYLAHLVDPEVAEATDAAVERRVSPRSTQPRE